MGLLTAILSSAVNNPDVRRFAGRMMATAANDCAAPNCRGKSLPGVVCTVCGKPMCNTHATAFLVAVPPKPLCPPCGMQLWNADADENQPAHEPSKITKRKPRNRKRR